MKIVLTGSSSTGKTTLIEALRSRDDFEDRFGTFLTTDARFLLDHLSFKNMGDMSRYQLRNFQFEYFVKKFGQESRADNYISDRSLVDVAAYWLARDSFDLPIEIQNAVIEPCRIAAQKYDRIFYLPFGAIPFHPDGYRSPDVALHKAVDKQIISFLELWNLEFTVLENPQLRKRVEIVLQESSKPANKGKTDRV